MNRQCEIAILCPPGLVNPNEFGGNTDSPIMNLSSEATDGISFSGLRFATWNPWSPFGHDPNNPNNPNNPPWYAQGCLQECVSIVSQDAADQCAAVQAFLCAMTPQVPLQPPPSPPGLPPTPPYLPPGGPFVPFYNTAQSCTVMCPDGTTQIGTVEAGTIASTSQELADQLAHDKACKDVTLHRICLGELSVTQFCLSQALLATVEVTGSFPPYVFSIGSGSLPPGVNLSSLDPKIAQIQAIPTAAGDYTFSIKATDPLGFSNEKQFNITVLGITNAGTIPSGTRMNAYAFQLHASGGTPPYAFQISSGALPGGLALDNASGIIHGTPTTAGVNSFGVSVRDSAGLVCALPASMTINSTTCLSDPSTLPDGTTGIAYTYTFSPTFIPAIGVTLQWAVSGGALPTGLNLNSSTGAISGTPTVVGVFNFTIRVTENPLGLSCTKDFKITVHDKVFKNMVWVGPTITLTDGVPTGSAASAILSEGSFVVNASTPRVDSGSPVADVKFYGTVNYAGPNANISISFVVSNILGSQASFGVQLLVNAAIKFSNNGRVAGNFTAGPFPIVNGDVIHLNTIASPAEMNVQSAGHVVGASATWVGTLSSS